MLPNNVRKVWPPLPDEGDEGQNVRGRGLECRKCGCRHLPVDHTHKSLRVIVRYRRCRHCGQRMTTHERPLPSDREAVASEH